MRFAYYPGCSAKSTCAELNTATHKVASRLGIELIELHSATCTGSREIRAIDRNRFLALNARIIALAEREQLPVLTVCNTCTLNLLDSQKILAEEPETREEVNALLAGEGCKYTGSSRVTHFLWMLLEDVGPEKLRKLVSRPLTGLRLAAFYGCHIVRPPAHYGFVDSRNAQAIETLNDILGCASIDYSGRTECCGFHTAASDERVAIKLTGRHIKSAKDGGAQAMVTPCPLCHTVLDSFQREMEQDLKKPLDMPILHLPQVVGLALGMSPRELQMHKHMIPVELNLA
jgi:succinate dehydrogenase / fumarate reductase, cytochrome b subunit